MGSLLNPERLQFPHPETCCHPSAGYFVLLPSTLWCGEVGQQSPALLCVEQEQIGPLGPNPAALICPCSWQLIYVSPTVARGGEHTGVPVVVAVGAVVPVMGAVGAAPALMCSSSCLKPMGLGRRPAAAKAPCWKGQN